MATPVRTLLSKIQTYKPLLLSGLIVFSLFNTPNSWGVDPINASKKDHLAIHGTDPVAYFTEGRMLEGSPAFAAEWMGKTWYFATKAHRESFVKNPQKYAPQFGGYCAYGIATGKAVDSDPNAWRIIDDKLYLNFSKEIQTLWVKDLRPNLAKANKNWPNVLNTVTPLDKDKDK